MLNQLALPFLVVGVCTALMIAKDLLRHPHPLAVMNIIWPLTGLYMPFFGWLAWWYLGRKPSRQRKLALLLPSGLTGYASWQTIFISTSLSAAACIFGDIITLPIVTLLKHFAISPALWLQAVICVMISLLAGLFFQFLAIRQREQLSIVRTLLLALKTETFPLLIYQTGIFIFMTLALKYVLNQQLNPLLSAFWFMLQLAMITGFIFSWPANHFLIKRGLNPAV
ncbi:MULTISPECIES: DUF4396 domain-containing protein [Pantoea]|jgi:hypothetical protein|uniref:DUF4396 domain-containing protein n=1 Tax=Pantoea TaxID=53335 RepID=UPI000FDA3037|nr:MULTISPECIES: DUF4396 domain-containing protein [Pantoea]KAA6103835.1 DUF4396 domain-containing protein [Pantoea sp. B_9]KAA6116043.1 DUF4396 domain-containing protein [Pantoea sp. B_10]KAF0854379.1 hypothetical protein Y788_16795 [Pantoea dispersa 625]MCI1026280.1 DUF4396 domain-containing protein [Pantoea dispersa]MCT6590145.1 DUF4396 domain-containing protein [Pantoea dispersa]